MKSGKKNKGNLYYLFTHAMYHYNDDNNERNEMLYSTLHYSF